MTVIDWSSTWFAYSVLPAPTARAIIALAATSRPVLKVVADITIPWTMPMPAMASKPSLPTHIRSAIWSRTPSRASVSWGQARNHRFPGTLPRVRSRWTLGGLPRRAMTAPSR